MQENPDEHVHGSPIKGLSKGASKATSSAAKQVHALASLQPRATPFIIPSSRCLARLTHTRSSAIFSADARHHDHAQHFLANLASGKYDCKYHYVDVHAADWLFMDGTLNARRTPPGPLARLLLVWDAGIANARACDAVRDAGRRSQSSTHLDSDPLLQ